MYFCNGLGGFVAPLIAIPFLSNVECGHREYNSSSNPIFPGHIPERFSTNVQYAFWIFAAIQVSSLLRIKFILIDALKFNVSFQMF